MSVTVYLPPNLVGLKMSALTVAYAEVLSVGIIIDALRKAYIVLQQDQPLIARRVLHVASSVNHCQHVMHAYASIFDIR